MDPRISTEGADSFAQVSRFSKYKLAVQSKLQRLAQLGYLNVHR